MKSVSIAAGYILKLGLLQKSKCHFLSCLLLILFTLMPLTAFAENNHVSKYAGQQNREIKSLSKDDIAELKRGGGWGLAKAAELNGMPGPAHILEMESKINLTAEQKLKIEKLFNDMRSQAIPLGNQLISLEEKLNNKFTTGKINKPALKKLVEEIEMVRAKLRVVHLAAHLETPKILSKHQIGLYNRLRGYDQDPCLQIPEGHDPEMWKKHNGCQ